MIGSAFKLTADELVLNPKRGKSPKAAKSKTGRRPGSVPTVKSVKLCERTDRAYKSWVKRVLVPHWQALITQTATQA